jgi:20S proteasome alpha/beta subunit
MTIAAGFVANDGVVLCTDSLYSGGIKVHGKKIFPMQLDGGAVAFALAGHEPFAKRAIEECFAFLGQNPDSQRSVRGIKTLVEAALKRFHEEFVFTRPVGERESVWFNLLVAIASLSEPPCLFASHETVLIPVPEHECFGVGYYVGHHVIETAYSRRMAVDDAVVLAIHAVAVAKEYVEGVGGQTQLLWIRNGTVSPFHPINSAIYTENYVMSFDRRSAELLFHTANPKLDEEEFQRHVDRFVSLTKMMRKYWREGFENQSVLQMLMHQGDQPGPEPPKRGP